MTAAPYAGIRVVDLCGLPGAYAGMLLAGLGAEVIKVEPPEGDPLRRLPPFHPSAAPPENGLWFAYFGSGKRSVVLDVESDAGRADLRALIASADVVLESGAPGQRADLGLDYARLSAEHPGLVWAAITPFGQDGPRAHWKGSDLVAWAASGLLYTIGFRERPPVAPATPVQFGAHLASLNATIGALLALRARKRTGRGQLIDISWAESCLAMSPECGVPLFLDDTVHRDRPGNRRELTRPFGLYPCKDGYVSFLVLNLPHWRAMARWIVDETGDEAALEELWEDMPMRLEAKELIDGWTEAITLEHTKLEVFLEGQRRGIPVSPVNTVADLRSDPHLAAAKYWVEVEHPALGTLNRPGHPFRVSPSFWLTARAPLLGEHTDAVLGALAR